MEVMNYARGLNYLYGVMKHQATDVHCRSCKACFNVLTKAREDLAQYEREHGEEVKKMSNEYSRLFAEAKEGIGSLPLPKDPVGQKKAGNCKLPEGVCFLKLSLATALKVTQ